MVEILETLGTPGLLIGFVLAAWKGPRGAIASFAIGPALLFFWFFIPTFNAHEITSVGALNVVLVGALAYSIPWWLGSFPGAALGIAARSFRARRISS